MFVEMLIGIASGALGSTGPQPAVSGVSVATGVTGQCTGSQFSGGALVTPATIVVSWAMANASSNYTTNIYENGVFLASVANTTTSYTKTISGAVQNGAASRFNANWVYRIDVVRNADSVVVSTASSAEWVQAYGQCS